MLPIHIVCIYLFLHLIGSSTSLKESGTSSLMPTCGVSALLRYPEYFRTDAQQAALERKTYCNARKQQQAHFRHLAFPGGTSTSNADVRCNTHRGTDTPTHNNKNNLLTVFTKTFLRFSSEKSDEFSFGQTYHACCMSKTVFLSPDTAKDLDGRSVTLVQIEGHRQNFKSETCRQVKDCAMGCTCRQDSKEVKAIVYNPDTGGDLPRCVVMDIYIPGCCKCFNADY